MTEEELEKDAREYLAEHSEYSEVFEETFVAVDTLTAMVEFAEQETKKLKEQIEKMKNCKNCANYMISGKCPSFLEQVVQKLENDKRGKE